MKLICRETSLSISNNPIELLVIVLFFNSWPKEQLFKTELWNIGGLIYKILMPWL